MEADERNRWAEVCLFISWNSVGIHHYDLNMTHGNSGALKLNGELRRVVALELGDLVSLRPAYYWLTVTAKIVLLYSPRKNNIIHRTTVINTELDGAMIYTI